MDIKLQMRNAIMQAMESQRAFSWMKTHKVQQGVYIEYPQAHFQTYCMN